MSIWYLPACRQGRDLGFYLDSGFCHLNFNPLFISNGVVPSRMKRVAPQKPGEAGDETSRETFLCNRSDHIFGTGGREATAHTQIRRQTNLVGTDKEYGETAQTTNSHRFIRLRHSDSISLYCNDLGLLINLKIRLDGYLKFLRFFLKISRRRRLARTLSWASLKTFLPTITPNREARATSAPASLRQ